MVCLCQIVITQLVYLVFCFRLGSLSKEHSKADREKPEPQDIEVEKVDVSPDIQGTTLFFQVVHVCLFSNSPQLYLAIKVDLLHVG